MKGLTKEIVLALSERKKEPAWMREFRLKALEIYQQMPMPGYGPDLSGLDMTNIATYVEPTQKMVEDWAEVPTEIRNTFEKLGIPQAERDGLAGVGAQYDSEVVYHNIKKQIAAAGVVYLPMEEAVKSQQIIEVNGKRQKIATVVKNHFMKL
ncbi:Fe-S cluster assembly protein SufB, partial [Candidatus Saccharibacteria bacterium]|nr:Fe-S cluster assembly protein SufB [Candidatus Saccharibacteria bacterium]